MNLSKQRGSHIDWLSLTLNPSLRLPPAARANLHAEKRPWSAKPSPRSHWPCCCSRPRRRLPPMLTRYPANSPAFADNPTLGQIFKTWSTATAAKSNRSTPTRARSASPAFPARCGRWWPTSGSGISGSGPKPRLPAPKSMWAATPAVLVLGQANQPPALYYFAYDRFAGSVARPLVPIEPDWLIRAWES